MGRRQKISTTVSPESYSYLQHLLRAGRARSLAQALDLALARVRRAENRFRLERDTAAYFEALTAKETAEESSLEAVLGDSVDELDFGA